MLYTLGVKILFLIHPLPLAKEAQAGFLYTSLISLLEHQLHWGNGHFQWIAIVLLLILALQLNQMLIRYHLLPGRNYYPAMSFILLSTFEPAWNQVSASLLATCFLLPAVALVLHPDHQVIKRPQLYHAGLSLGIASLLSISFSLFLMLLWIMMLVNRPFRVAEWLLVLMGWLTPFYFYAVISFLLNHFSWEMWKLPFHLQWPIGPLNPWTWLATGVLGFMFIIGFTLVWIHLSGMVIQVRKSWILLLCFGIIALGKILLGGASEADWLPLVVVIAAFASNLWWYLPVRRWVWTVNALHLLLILLAWATIYLPAHQPQIQLFPWKNPF